MANEIEQLIPHRPPFLFIDEIVAESADALTARRRVRGDEDFFKGHYPGNPLMPGVLLCEAVFQAGCVLQTKQAAAAGPGTEQLTPVLTRISDVRFKQLVRPGDELLIDVKVTERHGRFIFMSGSIKNAAGQRVLTVDFGVALVATPPAGEPPSSPP